MQLARTIYCFQRKTPRCKYWVLKVLCLETKMVCYGWLKNDLTLFAFVALIKMLCCQSMQWTGTWHTKTWSNWLCFALSIPMKICFRPLLYHHHSQEYFFNWNITSSSYLEMLLISMIKLFFLFFLSDRNVWWCNL